MKNVEESKNEQLKSFHPTKCNGKACLKSRKCSSDNEIKHYSKETLQNFFKKPIVPNSVKLFKNSIVSNCYMDENSEFSCSYNQGTPIHSSKGLHIFLEGSQSASFFHDQLPGYHSSQKKFQDPQKVCSQICAEKISNGHAATESLHCKNEINSEISGPHNSEFPSNQKTVFEDTSFCTKQYVHGHPHHFATDCLTKGNPCIAISEPLRPVKYTANALTTSNLQVAHCSSFSQFSPSTISPWKLETQKYVLHSLPNVRSHCTKEKFGCKLHSFQNWDASTCSLKSICSLDNCNPKPAVLQQCSHPTASYFQYEGEKTTYKKYKIKSNLSGNYALKKTAKKRRKNRRQNQSRARKNSALLAKKLAYKPNALLINRDVPDNLYTALFTTLFCFPPLGLASLVFSFMVRHYVAASDKEKARRSSLIGRKLANVGIMLGMIGLAVGIVYVFAATNIPYTASEYDYYLP